MMLISNNKKGLQDEEKKKTDQSNYDINPPIAKAVKKIIKTHHFLFSSYQSQE